MLNSSWANCTDNLLTANFAENNFLKGYFYTKYLHVMYEMLRSIKYLFDQKP